MLLYTKYYSQILEKNNCIKSKPICNAGHLKFKVQIKTNEVCPFLVISAKPEIIFCNTEIFVVTRIYSHISLLSEFTYLGSL